MMRFLLVSFNVLAVLAITKACLTVPKGQMTFDSEGNDNPKSRHFSRVPHVPTSWSGITIGRGYDLKYRRSANVIRDLKSAKIDSKFATTVAGGVGLSGRSASKFLLDKGIKGTVITRQQQCDLFAIVYAEEEKTTIRVVHKYTKAEWSKLQHKIQELLVDLKYRGDLTFYTNSTTMLLLKSAVENNSIAKLRQVMSKKKYWPKVPFDRYLRRRKFVLS